MTGPKDVKHKAGSKVQSNPNPSKVDGPNVPRLMPQPAELGRVQVNGVVQQKFKRGVPSKLTSTQDLDRARLARAKGTAFPVSGANGLEGRKNTAYVIAETVKDPKNAQERVVNKVYVRSLPMDADEGTVEGDYYLAGELNPER